MKEVREEEEIYQLCETMWVLEDHPVRRGSISWVLVVAPQEGPPLRLRKSPHHQSILVAAFSRAPRIQPKSNLNALGQTKVQACSKVSGFCYRCGEYGHMAKECTGPENPDLVFQQLKAHGGWEMWED